MYQMSERSSRLLGSRCIGGSSEKLEHWGADCEYGVLKKVLLGPAKHFTWMGEENLQFSSICRTTDRSEDKFDHDLAMRQHAEVVDAYQSAGVKVFMLEPDSHTPYAVYTRDSNVMTPFGPIVCQLANPRRRGEYAAVMRFYLAHEIPIYEMVSAGNFEGGDFNMIQPGAVLIGYTGQRTEERAARQIGAWMEREGWEVKYAPIDEFYVHIDLMVCMLAPKCAAVCLDTTPLDVIDWLKSKQIEMIEVNFRDTMQLSCNVVALGNDRILSTAGAADLNAKLKAHGFKVYDPDISMYIKAGGGVHCMSQPLQRLAG